MKIIIMTHISYLCVKGILVPIAKKNNFKVYFKEFQKCGIFPKKRISLLTSKPCKAQYAFNVVRLNQLYKTPRIPDAGLMATNNGTHECHTIVELMATNNGT